MENKKSKRVFTPPSAKKSYAPPSSKFAQSFLKKSNFAPPGRSKFIQRPSYLPRKKGDR